MRVLSNAPECHNLSLVFVGRTRALIVRLSNRAPYLHQGDTNNGDSHCPNTERLPVCRPISARRRRRNNCNNRRAILKKRLRRRKARNDHRRPSEYPLPGLRDRGLLKRHRVFLINMFGLSLGHRLANLRDQNCNNRATKRRKKLRTVLAKV